MEKKMPEIVLPYNWSVRADQKPLWDYLGSHIRDGRAVMIAHRRWGKDSVALNHTCCAAHERIGNYWHCLPEYRQAKKVVWDAINPDSGRLLIDEAFPKEVRKKTNEAEMKIDFKCGSSWQMVGSDNYNSYRGSPPIGVTFSEFAIANPMSWYVGIKPIIEQNHGYALFIYTPCGDNHGKTLYEYYLSQPEYFAKLLRADQTPVFTKAQLDKILRDMIGEIGDEAEAQALFNQEYMCSFAGAIRGAYYTRQMAQAEFDGRICEVHYQPAAEVYTYWDLGVDDSTSIWFVQHIGKSHHVIDYYENTGMGMDHYANILKDKKYNYAEHVMPHDADARGITGGELAKSPRELAEDSGLRPVQIVPRAQNMELIIKSHIPAVRNMISQCWFDRDKCAVGISALKSYHAEYNEEKKVISPRPSHDWSSHAADAFRTFAVGYAPKKPPAPHAEHRAHALF
jgi:phage terminase large subunit